MRRIWSARRGPVVVLVSTCLLSGGLAACRGDDPGPAHPTTMHPGTAVTPSTSTPTGDPTDIAYASAVAAVEKMYVEFNGALRSGRTTDYRTTFAKSCGYCQENARVIDTSTKHKRSVLGGQYTLTRMQKATIHGGDIYVQGWVSQAAARIVESGKTVQRFQAAQPFLVVWTVRQVHNTWIVTQEDVPR